MKLLVSLSLFLAGLLVNPDSHRPSVSEPAPGAVTGTVRIESQLTSVSRTRGSRYRRRGLADAAEAVGSAKKAPEVTNVVVYLEELDARRTYSPPSQPVRLVQQNTAFVPHILPIVKGTKVEIVNKDDYYHNVFSNSESKRFNIGRQLTNSVVTEIFETSAFVPVFCDIHLEMSAYVVVLDNPFFTIPDDNGTYTIPDVPPGRYRISVWHERLAGRQQEITVTDGGTVTVDLSL